jgi:2,3-bisphosphoglycerate-independent phosphoglycerate mutase
MALLFLLFFILCSLASSAEVRIGEAAKPAGGVICVVDGLGSSYVYPEEEAYTLQGSLLGKAVLFNITADGARVAEIRARVPETEKSHSILVTGNLDAEPDLLGPTIFDIAREKGFLCLALLQRGDFAGMLAEQDIVLYSANNSLREEPTLAGRAGAPQELLSLLEEERDRFGYYAANGARAYSQYNQWEIDAACDLLARLPSPFLLLINLGGVDSSGHYLGSSGYLQAIGDLDAPLGRLKEACKKRDAVLLITADHGMAFPEKGKGAHASTPYSSRLESLRIPLAVFGPGIEEMNLGGIHFQEEIAPTVLSLLGLPQNLSTSGRPLPLKETYQLKVLGADGEIDLLRGGDVLATVSGDESYVFSGLKRGSYTLRSRGGTQEIGINGDKEVELSREGDGHWRQILGVILILAINLAGMAVIIRIARKEEG